MVSINSSRLLFARENYNFSIDEVVEKTKIRKEDLLKFENGEDFPSYSQLEKLSNLYKQSLFFFFITDQPPQKVSEIAFRDNHFIDYKSLSAKTNEMTDRANIYQVNLQELYEGTNLNSFISLLHHDNVNSSNKLTDWLRKRLPLSLSEQIAVKASHELLELIRDRFYSLGVYIFKDSFKDNSISGLCLYDEHFPVILLNNKTSFTRQLFTIFHEIYHLYLRQGDIDYTRYSEERECNVFASNFLMPSKDFDAYIKDIDFDNNAECITLINALSNRYKTSQEAVMYRLLQKHLITTEFYEAHKKTEDQIRNINAASAGGDFYRTRISYLGKAYVHAVFNAYYSGKLSLSDVGTLTNIRQSNVVTLASYIGG